MEEKEGADEERMGSDAYKDRVMEFDHMYNNMKASQIPNTERVDPKDIKTRTCSKCGRSMARTVAKRCGRCKCAYYCDARCQKLHWSGGHSVQCSKCIGDGESGGSVLFDSENKIVILICDDGSRVRMHANDSARYDKMQKDAHCKNNV